MDFDIGLFADEDKTRFCYLRVSVLKALLKDPRVLDALLQTLEVPGKSLAALKKLDTREKLKLIEDQINHFKDVPLVWGRTTGSLCWLNLAQQPNE